MGLLLSIIRSPQFHEILEKTGGYDLSLTGTLRMLDAGNTLAPVSPPTGSP